MKLDLFPCRPPVWAKSGHAQTLLGHLLPSSKLTFSGKRKEWTLSDGDCLIGRYFAGKSNTIVFLFHGLGGSAEADYMQRTTAVALDLGHSVYAINHRGCGEGKGLAQGPYHSGRAEDLSVVLEAVKNEFPSYRQIAIGFSLSGNALLLLLSGERGRARPDAAIAVNAPINLEQAAFRLKKGFNKIYDKRFVLLCRKQIPRKELRARVPRFCTLHDFDNHYTAQAGGFRNREDYYSQCSAKPRLRNIKIPTIILAAKDDPFIPIEDYAEAEMGEGVHLHMENSGGHMGYLSRDVPHRWLDYALRESLRVLSV